jgi:hypothetical protein
MNIQDYINSPVEGISTCPHIDMNDADCLDRYMVIVTGTGRSGTATLARMLGGHHEFRAGYILDKYFSGLDPHADPFGTIEKRIAVILDLHQGIDGQTFVDSSNLYIHFIDAVFILNPSVRFVLSVRNGRDFVRSAQSRRWHESLSFGAQPNRNDPFSERWDRMTPLQRNTWIWVYRNKKAIEGLKNVPDGQKLILRIEDIGRKETLDELEKFSGIKIVRGLSEKRFNANPSFDLLPKEQWTDDMQWEFEDIAGEMMRAFNYS